MDIKTFITSKLSGEELDMMLKMLDKDDVQFIKFTLQKDKSDDQFEWYGSLRIKSKQQQETVNIEFSTLELKEFIRWWKVFNEGKRRRGKKIYNKY